MADPIQTIIKIDLNTITITIRLNMYLCLNHEAIVSKSNTFIFQILFDTLSGL